jgi:hypothetical protein
MALHHLPPHELTGNQVWYLQAANSVELCAEEKKAVLMVVWENYPLVF